MMAPLRPSPYRDRTIPWSAYLSLTLWVGFLLLIRSPQQSLMAHDEGWYAQQARWIVQTGDWVTQSWWGEPIHDRMMGIQWLIASSYQLFGISEGTARLPSAIACWGTVLLTFEIGRRCLTAPMAWWGAAILAVTPIWMQAGRLAIQEASLTALELLAIWALLRAEDRPVHRRRWGLLVGIAFGLAFMLKSVMIFVALAALLPYLLLDHPRHRHLLNPGLYIGFLIGLMPALGWLGLSMQRFGTMPLERTFGLIVSLSQESYHEAGPWYYLWNIPVNSFPWPLLALAGLWLGWQSPYPRKALWLGYPVVFFILLTLFSTRTWYYPLQFAPFVALLAALTLTHLGQVYQSGRRRRWLVTGTTALMGLLALGMIGFGVVAWGHPPWLPQAEARRYALVVAAAGVGWLMPAVVYWGDRQKLAFGRRTALWKGGWLMGPWGAIALLYATGLWGNYNPEIKTALTTPPLAPILATEPVNVVHNPNAFNLASQDMVILTFYSPQPGVAVTNGAELEAGSLAWIWADDLAQMPPGTEALGGVKTWRLVRVP